MGINDNDSPPILWNPGGGNPPYPPGTGNPTQGGGGGGGGGGGPTDPPLFRPNDPDDNDDETETTADLQLGWYGWDWTGDELDTIHGDSDGDGHWPSDRSVWVQLNDDFDRNPDGALKNGDQPKRDNQIPLDSTSIDDVVKPAGWWTGDELIPITFSFWNTQSAEGTYHIEYDESKVKMYRPAEDPNAGPDWEFVESGHEFDSSNEDERWYWGGGQFYLDPIGESAEANDVVITGTFEPDQGSVVSDDIRLTIANADLKADSANDSGFEPPVADNVKEDFLDYHYWDNPGKYVILNTGDSDADGVPGYLDGYNRDQQADDPTVVEQPLDDDSTNDVFVPIVLDLSDAVGEDATATFYYSGSDPLAAPAVENPAPSGSLRLWRKDGSEERDGHDLSEAGDYVKPYTAVSLNSLGGDEPVTLYVEALTPGKQYISVYVDPDGDGPLPTVLWDNIHLTAIQFGLGVDNNRDGTINLAGAAGDGTSAEKPYHFWLNDDTDGKRSDGVLDDVGGAANGADNVINNTRDLEDFAPLKLSLSSQLIDDESAVDDVTFSFSDYQDDPSIRLWSIGGDLNRLSNYLTDEQEAQTIVDTYGHSARFRRIDGQPFQMSWHDFLNDFYSTAEGGAIKTTPIIWEALTEGTGKLTVSLWKSGHIIATTDVSLELRPIKQFYEIWTMQGPGGTPFGDTYTAPDPRTVNPGGSVSVTPYPTEVMRTADAGDLSTADQLSDDYILFVHGWRMQPDERRSFAETSYKRLFWQGFKGRFGMYSWPTNWVDTDDIFKSAANRRNYNNSEMKAYASAAALRNLIKSLKADDYSVNLVAHSMGNVVASEALRQEAMSSDADKKIVHTYVASQAAAAASAYDPNVMLSPANFLHQNYEFYVPNSTPAPYYGLLRSAILEYNALRHGTVSYTFPLNDLVTATPDIYTNFPPTGQAYFEGIGDAADKMYNFYNPTDGAVGDADAWPLNQAMKSDTTILPVSNPWPYPLPSPLDEQFLPLNYDYNGTAFTEQWQGPAGITLPAVALNLAAGYGTANNNYDTYAAMAYGAEAKSWGLGATAGVGFGFTTVGQVDVQHDFSAAGRFDSTRPDHSGQFNMDNMRRHDYWNVLMKRFGLTVTADTTSALGGRK